MVVMSVDVCVLDRALASPLALSSAMISKKMAKTFKSRQIGLSYQNTSRLFEKS
jgi:DNA-binding Xre family transcriptional regulator